MSFRLFPQAFRPSVCRLEDRAVPAVIASYAVTQDWGSGFQAEVRLTNDGPSAVNFTSLDFKLPSTISSIWDAKLVSHVGTGYRVTNAGWNNTIAANGRASFGFVAVRGTSTQATDFVFNGGTVPPTNRPPVAAPDVAATQAGRPVRVAVLANDSDPDGDPLGLSHVGRAGRGTTMLDSDGTVTYTPNAGVTGSDSFSYTVSDGRGGIATGQVTVTVSALPTNRPPSAVADAGVTRTGTPLTLTVLANDTDPDGDVLRLTAVGNPGRGTAVANANGTVTYTPAAGFVGADEFTYTISDGRGGIATGRVAVSVEAETPTVSSWPANVFAPYVDATLWPTFDFVAAARTTGVKYYTLAFITADPSNLPAWGGFGSYGIGSEFGNGMKSQVAALRALGGDVAVSFGGASGRELAQAITDVTALTAAYRNVINAYGLTHVDFDIEGAAAGDRTSVDRRSMAIAALQREAASAGRELHVRFTLPVLPTGLTAEGLYVLQSAKAAGVRVDLVNIMAMDYGGGAAPNPQGRMGDYAIQAATSLFGQLTTLFGSTTTEAQRWKMIGVTPMIGMNDVTTEIFDQQEAREVQAWAAQRGIGLLSFWSINRDKQHATGQLGYVDLTSSSILQSPWEFSLIFGAFTG